MTCSPVLLWDAMTPVECQNAQPHLDDARSPFLHSNRPQFLRRSMIVRFVTVDNLFVLYAGPYWRTTSRLWARPTRVPDAFHSARQRNRITHKPYVTQT